MEIIKYSKKQKGVYQYKNQKGEFWGYRLKYKDQAGTRREKKKHGFKTESMAIESFFEVQHNINKKNYHAVNPSKMTFGELLDSVIEQNKPDEKGRGIWSSATHEIYKTLKKCWTTGTIDHIKLTDLSLELYQSAFINHYKSVTPTSLELYHRQVNAVMNEAVRRGYISDNRIRFAKLPKTNKEKKVKYLNVDQLNKLLDKAKFINPVYRTIFYIMAYTGMRIGEVRALRWNDIDFKYLTINVSRSISPDGEIGATKGRNRRTIECNDYVMHLLSNYKNWKLDNDGRRKSQDDADFLFKSKRIDGPVSHFAVGTALSDLSENAIGINMTSHYFRHTHASILLMSGHPPKSVAQRLGNTEATVINCYSHIIPGIAMNATDAFENHLKNGADSGARKFSVA